MNIAVVCGLIILVLLLVMLLAGAETIREVIPFPMNKNAMDIMMGAPATVDQKQLDDVHIRIQMPEEK